MADRADGEGLPCPFCGADADFAHGVSTGDHHYYECCKCGARGPVISSRYFGDFGEHLDPTNQAWVAWNTRAPEPTEVER